MIEGLGKKILSVLSGSFLKTGFEIAKVYFPPDMTPEKEAEVKLKFAQADHSRDMEVMQVVNAETAEFNQRIKDMEGTAKDLLGVPLLGTIILFLRGCQRPIWGFFTIYMDWKIFANEWVTNDMQDKMAIVINVLVLGFLFGERAVKNLMPLILSIWGKGSNVIQKE